MAVVGLELVAVPPEQAGPVVAVGHRRGTAPGRQGLLVGHLEEEQVGELLNVVAVGEAVVAEQVAVAPELLDDLLGVVVHSPWPAVEACSQAAGMRPQYRTSGSMS